ncbi:SUMF1/EgtB/PvdO family nonheme iron enzyme [Paenibacillus nasutitermitis]|uniref:Sulfatase-modifying factor enzyme domain-containing protein n=1 Tax=Paenibacillus nasutitermitis TaxID=1652958 RepID=A0A917E0L1_9BACL|nr:SUMF1/EgtB/PvdO family nonheme iron enzyme [Paenibacillus nasutitermitis]GGD89587.1 hypothetical protein GCM10010911_55250 [Paenibacillus nasutitermitis]
MNMTAYLRERYEKLEETERQALLESLTDRYPELVLKRFARFERFGMHTHTAVYELAGSEFVFVPGDTVTLGWESFTSGFDESTRQDVEETLEEYEIPDSETFIRSLMSPVRTAAVGSMLVECKLREIGWRTVDPDSEELTENSKEEIRKFEMSSSRMLTIYKTLRLSRSEAGTVVELYEAVSYETFLQQLQLKGFTLPSEDEWEYLCGGGSRLLWRWGDSFHYDMRIKHFEDPDHVGKPYDLELPNHFGISIAYDPYRFEVVDSPCLFKGGDGGSNICGGLGIALGYLPVATYFRGHSWDESTLEAYKADIGGDYTFYRRVIRL